MSTVVHRTQKRYLVSANTPDYPVEDWIINPDLSEVEYYDIRYWKITGDVITLMDEQERAAVDAALPTPRQDEPLMTYGYKTTAQVLAISGQIKGSKVFDTDIGEEVTWDGDIWIADSCIKTINGATTAVVFGDVVIFKAENNAINKTNSKDHKDVVGCVVYGGLMGSIITVRVEGTGKARVNGTALPMDFLNPEVDGYAKAQTNSSKGSFAKVLEAKNTAGIGLVLCIFGKAGGVSK